MYSWLVSLFTYISWFYIITILLGFVVVVLVSYGCSQSQNTQPFCHQYIPSFITTRLTYIRQILFRTSTQKHQMAEKSGAFIKEEPYRQKLKSLLNAQFRFPSGATKILEYLYIGDEHSATNLRLLRELRITHIINCAEGYCRTGNSYYGPKVKYLGFQAEDDTEYKMIQHFEQAYDFIEDARKRGGKVLIHCLMGINRSGLLSVAYVMKQKNIGPIAAASMVKKQRGLILTNDYFQSQLIHYANEKGLLELDHNKL